MIDAASLAITATILVGQRPWNDGTHAGRQEALRRRAGVPDRYRSSTSSCCWRVKIADVAVGKLPWGVTIR